MNSFPEGMLHFVQRSLPLALLAQLMFEVIQRHAAQLLRILPHSP